MSEATEAAGRMEQVVHELRILLSPEYGGPGAQLLDALQQQANHAAEVERLREAAKLALTELRHTPCRDDAGHTRCLRCAAIQALTSALAKPKLEEKP